MLLRRVTVQGLHAAGVQSALLSLRDWGASACANAASRHSSVRRYADISDPEFMRSTGLPVAERCKVHSIYFVSPSAPHPSILGVHQANKE